MGNKVLYAYVLADLAFAVTGAVTLGFSVVVQNNMLETAVEGEQAARNLLYQRFPLTAGIVNGVIILLTFLVTLPAIITPTRGWLKFSTFLILVCGLFSLVIGLFIWVLTLKTKGDFSSLWSSQSAQVQDLMQMRFNCCGYFNSTSPAFVTDAICPSPAAAALMRGCAAPISSYANIFVDDIFTAVFGMVGVDTVLIMATACLLKDRKERERFRHIDEKTGSNF